MDKIGANMGNIRMEAAESARTFFTIVRYRQAYPIRDRTDNSATYLGGLQFACLTPGADAQAPQLRPQRARGADLLSGGKDGCSIHAKVDANHAVTAAPEIRHLFR